MTAIPLLGGAIATEQAEFALSYPVNLEPVIIDSGLSKGQFRSAMGAVQKGTGPGVDRGGINWNGVLYRVMGTKLVKIGPDGTVVVLGDVGGAGPVSLDYGFGVLAIQSGTSLFYWNGTTLTQVTDPDLGQCLDMCWFDGYYVSTDGNSIVVTDLASPTSINPLKYGSAEADPDMVTGVMRVENGAELVAFGANTIEFFSNVGGSLFPFQVNTGATIPIGCVGPRAKCLFLTGFAFVGGGRNQANGVWSVAIGTPKKLSTRTIDDMLAEVSDPSTIILECRVSRDENRLYVHTPDWTAVYLSGASAAHQGAVWYIAKSGQGMEKGYRLRNAVNCYGQWWVGDTETGAVGILDESDSRHFGESAGWRFDTQILGNEGNGFIVHQLELIGLPGRGVIADPVIFLSMTTDGQTYSMERAASAGKAGERRKRIAWSPHRRIRNYVGLRFRGDSSALAGFAALQAQVEALSA